MNDSERLSNPKSLVCSIPVLVLTAYAMFELYSVDNYFLSDFSLDLSSSYGVVGFFYNLFVHIFRIICNYTVDIDYSICDCCLYDINSPWPFI